MSAFSRLSQNLILATAVLGFASSAQAATDRLLQISADGRTAGTLSLVLTSSGQISGLQIAGLDEVGESPRSPRFVSYQSVQAGAPLFTTRGYTVMEVIPQAGFNPTSGGNLTLRYYTNVLTGAHRDVTMQLVRDSAGSWDLIRDGRPLAGAVIDAGSLGIETIAWSTAGAQHEVPVIPNLLEELQGRELDDERNASARGETAVASVTERHHKGGVGETSAAPSLLSDAGQAAI